MRASCVRCGAAEQRVERGVVERRGAAAGRCGPGGCVFAAADSVAATAGAAEGEKEEEVLELVPARSCCWLEREEEVLLRVAVVDYRIGDE